MDDIRDYNAGYAEAEAEHSVLKHEYGQCWTSCVFGKPGDLCWWQRCVCGDPDCNSSCKKCCDSGLIEVNPTLNCILTHPESFPGCSAWMPCKCPRGKGKKVEIR